MKPNIKHLLITAATVSLLAGCSTTHQPTQWEYKVVQSNSWKPDVYKTGEDWRKGQEALMNEMGKDGWIFVTESDNNLYFKRPLK